MITELFFFRWWWRLILVVFAVTVVAVVVVAVVAVVVALGSADVRDWCCRRSMAALSTNEKEAKDRLKGTVVGGQRHQGRQLLICLAARLGQ